LAGWDEIQTWARRTFQLDRDEDHEFALTVTRQQPGEVPGGPARTRAQRVMVRHYEAWNKPMIELRSAFGELEDLDPKALLEESLHLPLGAIALHGRFLVIVHRECLDTLSVEGVQYLLSRVSLVADELEERRGSDRF
jgi:hypothetical protein